MPTFVLVHGTSCGGWIWQKVTRLLRGNGNEVYAPTLSGLSDRSHLVQCDINLTTHIADVVNLITYEDLSDVILVGNSYAGMVITGVAARAPERLKLLVYLDAYIPEDGQSEADLWPEELRAGVQADQAKSAGFRQPPSLALFGVTDPQVAKWAEARMTPQPLATYTEPVPTGSEASRALPRVFIHCTKNPPTTPPVFAPFAAKARAAGWAVCELETGHAAMLTAPREVAELLLELASK